VQSLAELSSKGPEGILKAGEIFLEFRQRLIDAGLSTEEFDKAITRH
jgi:hypothetical protein